MAFDYGLNANSTCSLEPILAISAGFGYFGCIQHAYLQICIVVTVIVYIFDLVWFPDTLVSMVLSVNGS